MVHARVEHRHLLVFAEASGTTGAYRGPPFFSFTAAFVDAIFTSAVFPSEGTIAPPTFAGG
jgi:hypothetical protein